MAVPSTSFDLVVASVDRTAELRRLFGSLERQTHQDFRVVLVDQNDDDRLDAVARAHPDLRIVTVRAARGLSRARNAALGHLRGDVVAFPDDDCVYPADLLDRVARRLEEAPDLAGVTGRAVDEDGVSTPSWSADAARLTPTNLWNRAISYTIFLRRDLVARTGEFDERLGLGAGTPSSSGEETDYLVRAVRLGGRIEYDPSLTVVHPARRYASDELSAIATRDGTSLGYILRKHRYPPHSVARLLVRPALGAAVAVAQRDRERAAFQLRTLAGRVAGYRGASSSKSSA